MKREGISQLSAVSRRVGMGLLLVMTGLVQATTTEPVSETTKPPTNLKFVDGHWTPWDPPTAPEGAAVYVIQKDDTLWDLAQRDLNDPFLWPQIWDKNRYILDSHWIYPGDPLTMPGPVTVVAEEMTPPEVEPSDGEESGDGLGDGAEGVDETGVPVAAAMTPPPPEPKGRPRGSVWQKPNPDAAAEWYEMLCSGYILADKWQSDEFIFASEEEHKVGLSPGDVVYMNRGLSDGVRPGDKYFVVHQEDKIIHPVYGRRVGFMVKKKGIAQVMVAQADTATLELIEGCDSVQVGYSLIPFKELVSPKRRDTDLEQYGVDDNDNTAGYVIWNEPAKNAVGEGDIVHIDLGMADGVEKGDYLMIYRDLVTEQNPNEAGFKNLRFRHKVRGVPALSVRKPERGKPIPRKMLGELIILETNHHTAVAKIMYSFREIYLGDQVQLMD